MRGGGWRHRSALSRMTVSVLLISFMAVSSLLVNSLLWWWIKGWLRYHNGGAGARQSNLPQSPRNQSKFDGSGQGLLARRQNAHHSSTFGMRTVISAESCETCGLSDKKTSSNWWKPRRKSPAQTRHHITKKLSTDNLSRMTVQRFGKLTTQS